MFTKVLTTTCSGIAKIIRQLLKLKSFTIVVIKFIAVNIELISARCRLKIARSRPIPIYPRRIEIRLTSSRISEGGSSQNARLVYQYRLTRLPTLCAITNGPS